MLWGYLPAALAGFLFTAIPNWTGRPALSPMALLALFTLWLAGRAAMFAAPDAATSQLLTASFLPVAAALAPARDRGRGQHTQYRRGRHDCWLLGRADCVLVVRHTDRRDSWFCRIIGLDDPDRRPRHPRLQPQLVEETRRNATTTRVRHGRQIRPAPDCRNGASVDRNRHQHADGHRCGPRRLCASPTPVALARAGGLERTASVCPTRSLCVACDRAGPSGSDQSWRLGQQ